MKFILNRLYLWVPEFAKLPFEKQKEIFVNLTYEVEEVSPLAKIEGVEIGYIESCEKHPNSDRLSFCKVNSAGKIWDVVCGGKNVATGQVIAHALPGSKVGTMEMQPKELRGIVSNGMILSIAEIFGLDKNIIESHNQGNIEIFSNNLLQTSRKQEDILKELCAEGNYVDLKILPDRQYVKSYLNLAMEISAITGFEVKLPMFEYKHTLKNDLKLDNSHQAHYIAKFIQKQHTSRPNIKVRLYLEGIQPKDNIEDTISYIKLLTGIEVKVTNHGDYSTAEVISSKTNTNDHYYKYALDLFLSIGMTQNKNISECSDIIGYSNVKKRKITVNKHFLNKFVGNEININLVKSKLEKLHFEITEQNDNLVISIPNYRNDINTIQEIIEEIIRMYGINNIKEIELKSKTISNKHIGYFDLIKTLSAYGLHEVKTYQLVEELVFDKYNIWKQNKKIKLDTSYTNKYNTFKSSLLPTLLEVYTYNYRKEQHSDLAFFEIQHVWVDNQMKTSISVIHDDLFQQDDNHPILKTKALIEAVLSQLKISDYKFVKLEEENNIFNPYQQANIELNNKVIGKIGEIHPSILRDQKLIRVDKVKSKLYFFELLI